MKSRKLAALFTLMFFASGLTVILGLQNPERGISAQRADLPPDPYLKIRMIDHVNRVLPCMRALPSSQAPQALVMWGDSLTDGTGITHPEGKTALEVTQQRLGDGRDAINLGMGGNLALAIAARAGVYATAVTVPGGQLPSDRHPVEVVPSIALLDGGGTLSLPVTIAGISGTLSRQNRPVVRPYFFTRSQRGTQIRVAGTQPLEVSNQGPPGAIEIFWLGTNDALRFGQDGVENVITVLKAIKQRSANKHLLILTLQPGGYYPGGLYMKSNGYAGAVLKINSFIRTNFAEGFVDIFKVLTTFESLKNNTVPASLRTDSIHLNASGYYLVGLAIAKAIQCAGW